MASENPENASAEQAPDDAPVADAKVTPDSANEMAADNGAEVAAEATDGSDAAQYAPDELPEGSAATRASGADINLDLVLDVPVNLALRVGSTDISIRDLVALVEGSVVALDRDADASMDVLVNGTLIAHGEIVVVDDRFGVRLTDVVTPVERIERLS